MRLLLCTLALLCASAGPVPQEDSIRIPNQGKVNVYADQDSEEGYIISISAEKGSVKELVRQIGFYVKREVVGLDLIARDPAIDIYLRSRPWREALRWSLGSAGLKARITATSIEVEEELPAHASADDAYMLAMLTWQRVRTQQPDHPEADRHEKALGDCAAALDDNFATIAIVHYENVLEKYRSSELVPECMLKAGQLYAQLGEWSSAALRFNELASVPSEHPFHAIARREQARALCHVGESEDNPTLRSENAEKALLTLAALDLNYPTTDSAERRSRALLTALALTLTDDPIQALRALDLAATYSSSGFQDIEIMDVRALALERAGRPGDAASAWLAKAEHLEGAEREEALVNAAQASLDGGHELATMAIVQHAKALGHGQALANYGRTAESRLGLISDVSALSLDQRIARGQELFSQESYAEASKVMAAAFTQRATLRPAVLESLAKDLARSLAAQNLPVEAIDVLRAAGMQLPEQHDKKPLYSLAADILEQQGRVEAAIEALEGRL